MEVDGLRLLPPRCVEFQGRAVQLTQQQWGLLAVLAARRGEVVRYSVLFGAAEIDCADKRHARNHVSVVWRGAERRLASIGCTLDCDTIYDQGRRLRGVAEDAE